MKPHAKDQLGRMTEQVSLTRAALTSDGMGGQTEDVSTPYADGLWAEVAPLGQGGEAQDSARTEAKAMYLVTIRNRSDVQERDFITWGGRKLNIRRIRARGARDLFLMIEAELGAAV